MIKQLQRLGTGLIIRITKDDQLRYNLLEGELYDVKLEKFDKKKEAKKQ